MGIRETSPKTERTIASNATTTSVAKEAGNASTAGDNKCYNSETLVLVWEKNLI